MLHPRIAQLPCAASVANFPHAPRTAASGIEAQTMIADDYSPPPLSSALDGTILILDVNAILSPSAFPPLAVPFSRYSSSDPEDLTRVSSAVAERRAEVCLLQGPGTERDAANLIRQTLGVRHADRPVSIVVLAYEHLTLPLVDEVRATGRKSNTWVYVADAGGSVYTLFEAAVKRRRSALGKYRHILGSSDDFAGQKQHELDREDRRTPPPHK